MPMKNRSVSRRLLALCAAAAAIAGCANLERDSPSSAYFMLAPPPQPQPEQSGAPLGSVVVRRTAVQRPFESRGFVYRLSNGQWRTDAYNGFLADPSDMVTDALSRALERSGRFAWVGPSTGTAPTDLAAESVVEAFYCDFSNPREPVAVVRLRAYLLDRADSGVRMRLALDGAGTAPLADGSPRAVADGLGVALSVALNGVISQLPQAAGAAPESR